MDSSVSAFSIYSTNKQPKPKRNKKKKNKKQYAFAVLKKSLKDNVAREISSKLKLKTKKQPKVITKTPIRKKKLNKENKIIQKHKQNSIQVVDTEEIPQLIPILPQLKKSEDNFSHSSQDSFEFTPVVTNSVEEGLKVFKWMIAPINPTEFLDEIWEKKPLHIARKKPNYYKDIISTPIIDNMLRSECIQFTKNIDITSYINGVRKTNNPEGRALPHLVWDFYLNGYSIRLLNPQTYISKLHLLNATLQEFFSSFVGANAYLTPPDSQGFAPHYDDIEAFILQAEGRKLWRIYKPRDVSEELPRISSKNFTDDEIGSPIMEVTLEAGDMLYFPRGYIHQGVTVPDEHSLHVTVSMYQKNSWADLFEKLIPAALQLAITEDVEFRKGLPLDITDNLGLVHSDVATPRKTKIIEIIHNLFDKIKNHLPIDEVADQFCKNFQRDALPPVLNDMEKAVTVFGDTDVMIKDGKVVNRVEFSLDTRIRLLRKNIIRLVSEDCIRIYFYAENSLEYHGNDLPFIEIDENIAPAIETLITSYPEYVSVENLDTPDESLKLQIADALWSRGLIMTEYPLDNIDDD